MRLFGSDRIAKVMDRMGIKDGEVITHSMVTKSIQRAQKKVEARNFSIRKHLLEYDDVMNSQRELVYNRRNFALHDTNISKLFNSIIEEYLDDLIDNYTNGSGNIKDIDWDDFCIEVLDTFGIDIASIESKINTRDDFLNHINQQKDSILNYKNESLPEGIFENFQKVMISQL